MHGSRLGLLAATMLVAGVAGCSLPEVLPLADGTHSGPSPYGPWYEQHWATNAVLLAAVDQPDDDDDAALAAENAEQDALIEAALAEEAAFAEESGAVRVETGAAIPDENADFDASTPYQFPSSSFAPPPAPEPVAEPLPATMLTPPAPSSGRADARPADGPIRY